MQFYKFLIKLFVVLFFSSSQAALLSGELDISDKSKDNNDNFDKLIEKDILNLEKCFLRTQYLVTGTNVLSSSISAETIFFLLEQAQKSEVKVVIDLNWREVFWDYSHFSLERIDVFV